MKKLVKFRPLRFVSKTGKITIASYMQWRNLMTSNYSEFDLIKLDDHKLMPDDAAVHNHKGEILYFFDYNPADVPVFQYSILFDLESIRDNNDQYGILWSIDGGVNYHMKGTDCDGVPTFSYMTRKYIDTNYKEISQFKILTVGMVVKWYGWILWQLDKSSLIRQPEKI